MLCLNKNSLIISIGARSSRLSRIQVQEIFTALQNFYPNISFEESYFESTGDLDQKTTLRNLDKTDFFTKEIDEAVLSGKCRLGIHSAKDLPFPLPAGLALICLTKGLDSADSLVLRQGETLSSLPSAACIATSSVRREETVKLLRRNLSFCDLRGTIEKRLSKLTTGEADGVVVAEAALIRLGLTDLNRVRLPGSTTEGQGRLAILARQDDMEMEELFACLHYEG